MALLHVIRGEREGETIPLDRDILVLGRSPDCDEVISKNEAVSRHHARIVRVDKGFLIEDHKKARNFVYINDQKIPPKTQIPLRHQDHIRICEFEATFLDVDADATVEAMLSSKSDHRLETQPAAKLAMLLDITAKLSKTLQLDTQLPEVADGLLRIFPQADRCFLILADEKSGVLIPKIIRTRRQIDESQEGFSKTIVRQCLRSAQAILLREGDRIPLSSESVSQFQIRSVMCVPLLPSEGEPFGVIQLDTQDSAKKFSEDDLRLLCGVANQASLAMENARLHELRLAQELSQLRVKSEQERVKNELEVARQVQLNFLPKELPELAGYEFFAFYEAAREVGGDYYDFVRLPDGRWAIILGDVAGKGMPAALLMAKLSSESRSCLLTERDLTAAIARLNDQLYPFTSPMDRFVTLIAATLDPATHTVTLVSAGHPAPLLYHHADGTYTKGVPAEDDGQSLGLNPGAGYHEYKIQLKPGDSLLIYSDGVTDAQNPEEKAFRLKGIRALLEKETPGRPRVLGELLVEAVRTHAAGSSQYDDITLVCFGRPAES